MSKSEASKALASAVVMILSSILATSILSAQAPGDSLLSQGLGCPVPLAQRPCSSASHPPWSLAAPRRESSPMRWDRGLPTLQASWSWPGQGPVSAPMSLRPVKAGRGHSALIGTHTGRVLLVEWNRSHSRLAGSWNVDGMVLGAPRWVDRERFMVGTDADTLHAFVRGSAKSQWSRQVGRCRHRRAPGPLGRRCDVGEGLAWQSATSQMLAVSDGVYAFDAQGQLRWQWPQGGGLARALGSAIRSDDQGNAYFGSQKGYAISLDPKGQLRWIVDFDAAIRQAPVLLGEDRVCFFAKNGKLGCLNRADGQSLWSFKAPSAAMGPMIADQKEGRIWASSADGSVFLLDPWGREVWRRRLRGLAEQGLIARDGEELVAVVQRRGATAYGVDRKTGRLTWQARLGEGLPGQVLCAGDRWLMQLRPNGELQGYWMPLAARYRQERGHGVPGLLQSLAR